MALAKPIPETKGVVDKISDFIAWFLGSWWAVVIHALWFTAWLMLHFNVNILTLSVSLEAIFIGIFLLIAANKAEVQRDLRESRLREKERRRTEFDIRLDRKADIQLEELRKDLGAIKEEIKELKIFFKYKNHQR